RIFRVAVGILASVPIVMNIPSIALAAYASHAQALSPPMSWVLTVHSGARFLTAAGRDEVMAKRFDAPTPRWDWRLAGTVLAPDLRLALFAQRGRTRAVQEGNAIDGWIVTSVGRGAVTLSAAGQMREIHLEGISRDEATARANAAVLTTSRQHDTE